MVLLVTGIAGFIGTNFAYYYLNEHPDEKILGVDKLTYASNIENLSNLDKNRFMFVKGDISDETFIMSLFKKYDISGIINFAAESHVDRSINDPSVFIQSNIFGVYNLLNCSKQNMYKQNEWRDDFRYLQISTDEVYGSTNNVKFTESTSIHPNNPYSASKASGDMFVQAYCNTYNFPGLISRCSNNYGFYQHDEKFIPTIIRKSVAHQKIPVYGDGMQIRDWIHVLDHCSAIDRIMLNGRSGEIYNIGSDNEWTNIDLVKQIIIIIKEFRNDKSINFDLITHVDDRPGHDKRYAMDYEKIKTQLGWRPMINFKIGLKDTIKWYFNH